MNGNPLFIVYFVFPESVTSGVGPVVCVPVVPVVEVLVELVDPDDLWV